MKKTVVAVLMLCFALNMKMTAYAAPEMMPDGEIFDAEYYAENNPDAAAALGTDTKELYKHYVNFGRMEGRQCLDWENDSELIALLQIEKKVIKISFAGDCTLGSFKGQGGGNMFGSYYDQYGADYYFKNVKDIFEDDDVTFVNLEGALTNHVQAVEKTYSIKGEPKYAEVLKSGSIEAVSIANNHTFDCGKAGYDECRQILTDNGIVYCGDSYTGIVECRGVKAGFIGLNCWGISGTLIKMLQDNINNLRDNGCCIVCVMFHGGTEHEYSSTKTTETFAHNAVDLGADIVVGAHPHVVQGIEIYNGKVICYSLGNFSFGANKNPSDKDTFIFQQSFIVNPDGTASYGESNIIPCKVSSTDIRNDYCPTPQIGSEYDRIMMKLEDISKKYACSYFASNS